jgi:hypothetical protein
MEDEMLRVHWLARGGLTLGLLLLSTTWACAQQRREEGRTVQVRRVSAVIGTSVVLREKASLGKIEDIVLSEEGCVEYLVVAYQEKFILVPWVATQVDFERRTVLVDIEKERFKEVPTFTREKWPDFSDTKYIEKIHTFYGTKPGHRGRPEEKREEKKKPPE